MFYVNLQLLNSIFLLDLVIILTLQVFVVVVIVLVQIKGRSWNDQEVHYLTSNQIAYWSQVEQARHNLQTENAQSRQADASLSQAESAARNATSNEKNAESNARNASNSIAGTVLGTYSKMYGDTVKAGATVFGTLIKGGLL